ncbi:polysaccharide pyruvyl transferase family protein [Cellvibrio sp. PSBB006]|uniref:polysaccharide pyruvyl transferase family protein n=1 Tax=Cellvibrio sp. PSBB006 TaxID=1987723 RepID=UPI000B3B27B2|nr:polysaccharide pyruvyl transferase family protein [Cellvibrio sp. PSBB006]ARU26809.1 hypothetical protein CBR65_04845 [Cellvibrio sp. PSBB006]
MRLKVFIWGCYWQGNFGDDLMAVIIGRKIKSMGHDVVVFRLPAELAIKYELTSVSSAIEGVSSADVVVLGGGAFLKESVGLLRRLISKASVEIENEISVLANLIESKGTPVISVSIGSDGVSSFSDVAPSRKKIITSKNFIGGTYRLPSDELFFNHTSVSGRMKHYPDVLFGTYESDVLSKPVESKLSSKKRCIGVNVSHRHSDLAKELVRWSKKEGVDIDFVLTHSVESGINSEYGSRGALEGNVFRNYDPVKFALELDKYDAIISVKLHLGLVSLMRGCKFFTYNPRGKTRNQLNEIGLSKYLDTASSPKEYVQQLSSWLEAPYQLSSEKKDILVEGALAQFSYIEHLLGLVGKSG